MMNKKIWTALLWVGFALMLVTPVAGAGGAHEAHGYTELPHSLQHYEAKEAAEGITSVVGILKHRVQQDPFNLVASLIFLAAIIHTFAAGWFRKKAHEIEEAHEREIHAKGRTASAKPYKLAKDDTSFKGSLFHFLGEVEAIFGIWCVPLGISVLVFYDWSSLVHYFDFKVNYTEAIFVVIIMAIASTRPVLKFAEMLLGGVARVLGGNTGAWWLSILTIAPLLGSFITEPAAMTIAALLLAQQFYQLDPSPRFKYATLGLLFVNISVGGTLTHFAAPPVLMVAGTWDWNLSFMFTHFGWRAAMGILAANLLYFMIFRAEFRVLDAKQLAQRTGDVSVEEPIPAWITVVVLAFMAFTVFSLHHSVVVVAAFLFFLAFVEATRTHQDEVRIKGPLLVGFFLAGLVTHGQFQQWWIAPVLGSLGKIPLFIGATFLTAFNDNAAITYLASQVPSFGEIGAEGVRYAVVAGAVTGGGLTVIANAPNPAGQSLLQRFFSNGISPINLLLGALAPTLIMAFFFMVI